MARRAGAIALLPPDPSDPMVEEAMPRAIRLTRPHGFIDEDGRHRMWHAGHVVDDADEVSLLVRRGAQHEIVE